MAAGGVLPSFDFDFQNGRYYQESIASVDPNVLLTTSRASTGYAENTAGVWTSFANNIARITNKGLLIEEARTNVVLWCRDLTNAAWTKSNITAALNQTGIDGTSNSASSLTATAGNGTVLQSITLASSARFQSAFVKRLVGTGTINMTTDNGSTWTAIVPTADWSRLAIPTQTLANPTVGFRIVTSGDSIAVDFVQNENGIISTSPILVTTVAAARAADNTTISTVPSFTSAVAARVESVPNNAFIASQINIMLQLDDGTSNNRAVLRRLNTNGHHSFAIVVGGATISTADFGTVWAVNESGKLAFSSTSGATYSAANAIGSNLVATTYTGPTVTTIRFGKDVGAANYCNGYIRRATGWTSSLPRASVSSITR